MHMIPIHPGRILKREMQARDLTISRLSAELRTNPGRVSEIVNQHRGISPEMALRLVRYFGNSARFWLNLQTAYELAISEQKFGDRIITEVNPAAA